MLFPFFIAKRYFLSKKKSNFINIISWMSMFGVALGTMSLIVTLSVFNGLEDLIRSIYSSFDPEIKVTLVEGKSFEMDSVQFKKIQTQIPNAVIVRCIEDNALLKFQDKQTIVKIKGFSDDFSFAFAPNMKIIEGAAKLKDFGKDFAVVGGGVQQKLGFAIQNAHTILQFWYPKSDGNLIQNPTNAFNNEAIFPSGSFLLEKQYDDSYVFVPLSFASKLLEYGNKLTSLEIYSKENANLEQIESKLSNILGPKFKVTPRDELHISMIRAIKIEKLFVYIVFCFILGVCCLNIFFTLSMLAIEKKSDIKTLVALGTSSKQINKIFLYEGYISGIVGASVGLLLGFSICFLQQKFEFVSMGAETALVNAYPVKMRISDFLFTGISMLVITFIISYLPAKKAESFAEKFRD